MIWTWRDRWERATFAPCAETAILACPGPSLVGAPKNLQGPQRTVFAINTAYPTVRPDYWIGMDEAFCDDPNLLDESFPKLYRGSYSQMEYDGVPVRKSPSTYFIDVAAVQDNQTMFDVQGGFAWHNHTLGVALHFIIWLGARRIYLLGCDLGGNADYCHDLKLTDEQRKRNRRLYAQQEYFLDELSIVCRQYRIELLSATPQSSINQFLPYRPIEDVIAIEPRTGKPRYVLDRPSEGRNQ